MVQNLGRKTILILALLVGAVLSIVLPEEPFRYGLDLQGGTRLVYKLDWDQALAEGKISEAEYADQATLLSNTLDILRERVDPNGVLEASFIAQGTDRFVIEIPSTANITGSDAAGTLKESMDALQSSLVLDTADEAMLQQFPSTGGKLQIGSERLSYERRNNNTLLEISRGIDGTSPAAHDVQSLVELKGEDAIRSLIENPGSMKVYIGAETTDFPPGSDITAETEKARQWRLKNPDTPISTYNQKLAAPGGSPLPNLRAFPQRIFDKQGNVIDDPSNIVLLLNPKPEWNFTGDDLKNVNRSQDSYGYPAVGLEMSTEKQFVFSDFTGANKGKGMAIVLNDEIVTLATIRNKLSGSFIIEGGGGSGFTQPEVDEMVKVLKSGSLIMKPIIEQTERVGAKLGDEYVKQGFTSAILGLLLVLVFMVIYYRKLGIFAALSLMCALVFLMGGMAALQATLTLPGVAGIILTVGMAVDANILIYERIREELARGRKLAQACENGFQRAFVTIIDANVTTFITGFILWKVGTGPVRGFATTLMIGIVTSVFAALVITRVMVDASIKKGNDRFSMATIIKDSHVAFMSKAKLVLPFSAFLIISGVGLFISLPESETMGIDFVGGVSVTVNLEEPQTPDTVRERIRGIEGTLGSSAEVVALKATGDSDAGFRTFRITYKSLVDVSQDQQAGAEATGEDDIRSALSDLLAKGPITARLEGSGAAGRLYFDEPHLIEDLQAKLASGGFGEVQVQEVPDFIGTYTFTTTECPTDNSNLLKPRLSTLFANQVDSRGVNYQLAQPIPSVSVVGAQVVGEMRDAAILAILISLFAIVMYIRVRFTEYSYGFAAVAALIHDVLITLGALAICDHFHIINAEISLPMIAAFLTIIGYSLNDTIVVFDRIRENRPRMSSKPLAEVLDISINQTLSRTILTSITTLITVVVLFVFNYGSGSVLEGFAFALTFGVIVGTYSSVFVASPALIFFEHVAEKRAKAAAKKTGGGSRSGSAA